MRAVVFVLDAELAEDMIHVLAQFFRALGGGHCGQHDFRARAIEGIQFQQTIAAARQDLFDFDGAGARLLEQGGDRSLVTGRRHAGFEWRTKFAVQGRPCRANMLEGVDTFVQPAHQHGLRGGAETRHMDLDGMPLADAIEAADALFDQIGILRHIEQHQMARKLEVAALAADFGTDQQLCVFFGIGEIGRRAIARNQIESFMKDCRAYALAQPQPGFQGLRGVSARADYESFVAAILRQPGGQPVGTWVQRQPVFRETLLRYELRGKRRIARAFAIDGWHVELVQA